MSGVQAHAGEVVATGTDHPLSEDFATCLVVDFGAQYAQLIARRVREAHVYSEIVPHSIAAAEVRERRPAALILSGGPKSVHVDGAPRLDPEIYELGIPILGICYGAQLVAQQLGGEVARGGKGEYGRTELTVTGDSPPGLLADQPADQTVWMSHFDGITRVPDGFVATATSDGAPVAALESPGRRIWGVQYHPEVSHTPCGQQVIARFLHQLAGIPPSWTMTSVIEQQVAAVRAQVGDARVICALSGGVDSAVAAALVHKAIGPQLTCVFVDTGLLRQGEGEQVVETFQRHQRIELIHVRAADRFFERLAGVTDPEEKRKIVGELFIRIFEEAAGGLEDARFLVQGTLYPDVIESGTARRRREHQEPPQRGRPARGHDLRAGRAAARAVQGRGRARSARSSACPTRSCGASRSPARAWRCASSARSRPSKVAMLQHADAIVREELKRAGLEREIWQVVRRAARHPLGRRDGRRAHLRPPDHHPRRHERGRHDRRLGPPALRRCSRRCRAASSTRCAGINRVVYDITSKPPGHDRVGVAPTSGGAGCRHGTDGRQERGQSPVVTATGAPVAAPGTASPRTSPSPFSVSWLRPVMNATP